MEATKMAWVLSYVQRGVAEVQKDNLLDELLKKESEVETVEELFKKMRNEFGETEEEERKVEQLRTIEQGSRTYNEYVQEFKKIARGSGYEKWPLIKEFKRGLNRGVRRKLAEAETPLYNRGVAGEVSKIGQKSETEQDREEDCKDLG